MNQYNTEIEAIVDMHKRGFCDDFLLFGLDLLWVQEGIFIRSGDYNLIDCHTFIKNDKGKPGIILFGVEVISYNVKGILIYHNKDYTHRPPAIIQKLEQLNIAHSKKSL